jgi:CRISPR/Cas system CSM-associated protein Csm4 (group 5 of RAMP superfamily)
MNYSELLLYRIDHWARLFKAKTWEELKMAAKNDQYLQEACEALYSMNADNTIRAQCRARADYEFWELCTNQKIRDLTAERDAATKQLEKAMKLLADHGISVDSLVE